MLMPFKKEHLEVMTMRTHESDVMALSPNIGDILEQSTVSRTGVINGRIIACGGVSKNIYGSGEVWLIPSIFVSDHKVKFLRTVMDWLDDVCRCYDIKRLQTACIDDELHNNYMLFLGFEKEGTMKKYALGQNYNLWGRLWE